MIRNLAIISLNRYLLASKAPALRALVGRQMSKFSSELDTHQNRITIKRLHRTSSVSQIDLDGSDDNQIDFKVIKDTQLIGQSISFKSNIELDDLNFQLGDEEFLLNLTWLRDFCFCPKCMHQYSRQKLFTIKDFDKNKFVLNEVRFLQMSHRGHDSPYNHDLNLSEDKITLRWSDGHDSSYPISLLRYINGLAKRSQLNLVKNHDYHQNNNNNNLFEFPSDDYYSPFEANQVKPILWDVHTINSNLEPVDYQDLVDNFNLHLTETGSTFINSNNVDDMSKKRFEAIERLTMNLTTYGLAKIVNVPREKGQVLNVARSLAYERPTGYGRVFDVVVEPSEDINLAYSALEFDLHTDLPYRESSPGVQLLHCISNSTIGGDSYFCDAFKAAQELRNSESKLFSVLINFPTTFSVRDPYRDIRLRRHHTIIKLDHQGNFEEINYSPFHLPPIGAKEDVKLFYLAMDKFTQLLQSVEHKWRFKMSPGDLFIFNNRRVLHGRSAYDSYKSRRFLQGCYMDWDEIRGLYEKLQAHKGLLKEKQAIE